MPSPNRALLHNYIGELRQLRDAPEFNLSPDIDMVWVFSGHGTYGQPGDLVPYNGVSFDRLNIEAGIETVRGITAERLGKSVTDVTKSDVADHGPVLFYNGESAETEGMHYPQNEALANAIEDPTFPLPASKVTIRPIDKGFTPAQMDGFVRYMEELRDAGQPTPNNVAVISSFGHRPRVGRYLEHNMHRFPEGITFVNGPVPNEAGANVEGLGIVHAEAWRVLNYHAAGHLATNSVLAR